MWILIRASEDGNSIRILKDDAVAEIFAGEWNLELVAEPPSRFSGDWNTNYWEEGKGILLRAEIVVPES